VLRIGHSQSFRLGCQACLLAIHASLKPSRSGIGSAWTHQLRITRTMCPDHHDPESQRGVVFSADEDSLFLEEAHESCPAQLAGLFALAQNRKVHGRRASYTFIPGAAKCSVSANHGQYRQQVPAVRLTLF
jgi:hypothetical protein